MLSSEDDCLASQEVDNLSSDIKKKRKRFGIPGFRQRNDDAVQRPGAYNVRHTDNGDISNNTRKTRKNIIELREEQKTRQLGRDLHDGPIESGGDDDLGQLQGIMMDQQDEEFNENKRIKRHRFLCCVVTISLVVLAITVAIVFLTRQPNSSPSGSLTGETLIDACISGATAMSDQYIRQKAVVTTHSPEFLESLNQPNSTNRMSLCWIVHSFNSSHIEGPELIQRFALGATYFHFDASSSQNDLASSNWLSEAHECDWDFVSCRGNKIVTGLFFRHLKLEGSIPSSIRLLTNLEGLYVHFNELSGTIPSWLFSMTQLTGLDLGSNLLTGTISDDILKLQKLEYFELSTNPGLTWTIPSQLDQLSALKSFNVINIVGVTGSLQNLLLQLSNLEELRLANVDIVGYIPSEIGLLDRLTVLSLVGLSVSGTIPTEIGMVKTLEHLKLQDLQIEGTIPTELGNVASLESLDMFLRIDSKLPSELGQLTSLVEFVFLSVSGTSETDQLNWQMPEEVCSLLGESLESLIVDCVLECQCCTSCGSK